MTTTKLIAALAAAMAFLPACGDLKKNTIPVDIVAYRPDGSLVLFTAQGIHVFDGTLTSELSYIPFTGFPPPATGAMQYSLSGDGTTAAVAFSSLNLTSPSQIAIFGIPGGELLNTFEFPVTGSIDTPALSPDGKLLYAVINEPMVLDTTTGATVWFDDTLDSSLRLLPVWAADGATLFWFETGAHKLDAVDARTETLKWRTDLDGDFVYGLAVTGNGATLAGVAEPPPTTNCSDPGGCPFFPFWSTADGTPQSQLPYVPQNGVYESTVDGLGAFACNATDTCAIGLRDFGHQDQPKHVRVYKPDGTVLASLPSDGATPSVAVSPDGQFVTTAAEAGLQGGAKVFSVVTGSVVDQVEFPTETF